MASEPERHRRVVPEQVILNLFLRDQLVDDGLLSALGFDFAEPLRQQRLNDKEIVAARRKVELRHLAFDIDRLLEEEDAPFPRATGQ